LKDIYRWDVFQISSFYACEFPKDQCKFALMLTSVDRKCEQQMDCVRKAIKLFHRYTDSAVTLHGIGSDFEVTKMSGEPPLTPSRGIKSLWDIAEKEEQKSPAAEAINSEFPDLNALSKLEMITNKCFSFMCLNAGVIIDLRFNF